MTSIRMRGLHRIEQEIPKILCFPCLDQWIIENDIRLDDLIPNWPGNHFMIWPDRTPNACHVYPYSDPWPILTTLYGKDTQLALAHLKLEFGLSGMLHSWALGQAWHHLSAYTGPFGRTYNDSPHSLWWCHACEKEFFRSIFAAQFAHTNHQPMCKCDFKETKMAAADYENDESDRTCVPWRDTSDGNNKSLPIPSISLL
jgi:hypothetical protein